MKQPGPKKYTVKQLKKVGVTLLDADRALMRCDVCSQEWSPNIQSGGRLPKRYWHCPHGCNDRKSQVEGDKA